MSAATVRAAMRAAVRAEQRAQHLADDAAERVWVASLGEPVDPDGDRRRQLLHIAVIGLRVGATSLERVTAADLRWLLATAWPHVAAGVVADLRHVRDVLGPLLAVLDDAEAVPS